MAITETVHPERRKSDRTEGPTLRRRHGQLVHTRIERRHPYAGFDIAAALELHLDRFPTREAMLVLLESWFYQAEVSGLGEHVGGYAEAVARAAEIMRAAPDAETGI